MYSWIRPPVLKRRYHSDGYKATTWSRFFINIVIYYIIFSTSSGWRFSVGSYGIARYSVCWTSYRDFFFLRKLTLDIINYIFLSLPSCEGECDTRYTYNINIIIIIIISTVNVTTKSRFPWPPRTSYLSHKRSHESLRKS